MSQAFSTRRGQPSTCKLDWRRRGIILFWYHDITWYHMISLFWDSGVGHLLHTGRRRTFRIRYLQLRQLWIWMANVWDVEIVLPEAGKFPQGFMMGLLGFLIGLTWWAMCMMIGTCGYKICPKQKDGNVLKQWWNMNMFDLFTGSISVSSLREYSIKDTETLGLYRWICRIKRLNAFLQASGGHESAEFIPNLPDDPVSLLSVLTLLCRTCRGTCVNIAGFQTIEDENLFIFIFFTIFCVTSPNKRIKSVDFKQLKSNLFNGCSRC